MTIKKKRFNITVFFLIFLTIAVTAGCGSVGGGGGEAPDTAPPVVSSTTPSNGATGVGINSAIAATFSETIDASTINTSTFTLSGGVTGTVTYSGRTATFTPSANLAPNTAYTATITTGVRDLAGNAMASPYTWSFTTGAAPDTTPPIVSSTTPLNNATWVSVNAPITVTFDEAVDTASINTDTFTLSPGVMGDVSYSDKVATFTPLTPLDYSTTYTATITTGVRDLAGNAMASPYTWSFTTGIPPANTTGAKFINSGADKTNSTTVTLSISATSIIEITGYFLSEDPTTPSASDPGWVSITPTTTYSADVSYTLSSGEGTKTVYVWFRDAVGDVSVSASGSIILSLPPAVEITSPENLITLGSSPIAVSGTVDDPNAVVTINGVPVSLSNGTFSISGITLTEGMNTIVARAIDQDNNVSTASINISLDSTPPHIAITSPPDGYVATASPITVTGIINDIVRGTVNENQGRVLVNGMEATVANRAFSVVDVPLNPGVNTITAVGSDQVGNTATTAITVNLDLSANARINLYSGDNQSGAIGSPLSGPLVVYLNDEIGAPVPGKTVVFRVIENNGTLNGGERAISVTSNSNGLASSNYTLGTWAGSGNNKVEAKAVGFTGSVIFTASGIQKPPAAIYVAQGSQQRGAINQPLPEPLVAFVTDEGHNPLGNIPILFKAVEGGGHFANGLDNITLNSDSDGRASVAFILGPAAGNDSNIIEATFEGNTGPPASFTATALIPGDPGNTKISGIVLDNSNSPIPNVTVRVEGTSREAKTDANGQFVIDNVPVGPVHLIADGSTAGTLGVIEYPTLMYELTTIAGADNTIGMPIYLLPLDLSNARWVGGNQDVTYTIPSIPGFSLTIKKNSVTFPDGRKQGLISVTQVHADKVPMVPQIGQQPRFIVTIQPPGAIFDPPAPITLPNVDELAPGEKTNMYSFDHDLGIFVSIGTGTVSEDGSVIQSDPGVGVVKAGWHCGGNPAPTGSANNCPECQKCVDNRCENEPDASGCKDDGKSNTCDVCKSGKCEHPGMEIVTPANNTRYDITTAPAMPQINVSARAIGTTSQATCSLNFLLSDPDHASCVDQTISNTNWRPDLGDAQLTFTDFMGGDFELTTTCRVVPCPSPLTQRLSGIIRGIDPPAADIRAAIGGDNTAEKIACQESGWHQFRADGTPVMGPTNDVGIFQIVTGQTCADVWNWRVNVASGLGILNGKRAFAAGIPEKVRTRVYRGQGPFPDATNFTPDQLEKEAIQRYNSGNLDDRGYWIWDDTQKQWVASPYNSYVADVESRPIPCR